MTLPQAGAAPITNNEAIETITLKNLVALDLVEKNEYLLKAFKLLDDSATKIILGDNKSTQQLESLIQEKQKELDLQQEELKTFKNQISQEKNNDNELINKLASEFLKDDIAEDDIGHLITQFEKENNAKVLLDQSAEHYKRFSIDLGIDVATKPEEPQSIVEPTTQPTSKQPVEEESVSETTIVVPSSAPGYVAENTSVEQPTSSQDQTTNQVTTDTVMQE